MRSRIHHSTVTSIRQCVQVNTTVLTHKLDSQYAQVFTIVRRHKLDRQCDQLITTTLRTQLENAIK